MTFPPSETTRRYAISAAVGASILSPPLALAYFGTADGASSADEAFLGWWIEPARQLLRPLITFASSDAVYSIYLLVLALLFPAIVISAFAVRSSRPAPRGGERWGWRLALPGYALLGVGLLVVGLLLVALGPDAAVVNVLFLATILPGLLIGLLGSTVLGVALLRRGFRPRAAAWLLALALPLWFVGSAGLGHNGLGIVPLFIAWAAATRPLGDLFASEDRSPVPAEVERN